MKWEPRSESLRRILQVWRGKSHLQKKSINYEVVAKNWESIVKDVCYGLSAADIATKYKVARRTLFRILRDLGVTIPEIQKACREEEEIKRLSREEKLKKKMERLKMLPSSLEDFMKLPIIEEFVRQLRVKGDTNETIKRNIKVIFELCHYKDKHPEDITIDDIIEFIDAKRLEWAEKGKDLRKPEVAAQFSTQYISPLRVWCQFKGLPIPPALSTAEYHSPYRKVRITVEYRYRLLKWLKENERLLKRHKLTYEEVRAALIFLYETGSRAQALTKKNTEIIETEEYGVKVWYAHTREKGKKYAIEWWKPLSPKWVKYMLGHIPFENENKVNSLRKVLKLAYESVLPEGLTKKYALAHPIHVWRHTAANDLLESTNWNLMIVAKRLGWKNPSMIVNVYGDMDKAALLQISGYNVEFKKARFEFLWGEWEEKAKTEGLI